MAEFQSDGLSLFYMDAAPDSAVPGEPILLIHGFASTHVVNWVDPLWVKTLTAAGRRVIAFDNRGHGLSDKPHHRDDYRVELMAQDARRLLDHLGIEQADVMGYSLGARISAVLSRDAPERVRSVVFGGLGIHMVDGAGLPQSIAEAMEAPSLEAVTQPMARMFRRFADANGSDLRALAACIRGSRGTLTPAELSTIQCPVLVAVGTKDMIGGEPHALAALLPKGEALDIPGRDHNLAVGDKIFKAAVLDFLARRA